MSTLAAPAEPPSDTRYNPGVVEPRWAEAWEQAGCYTPRPDTAEHFSIMMPPPNVTGTLHLGHALDNTLPDILIRRARMQGKAALYQPGTDHASIAVHVVLEKQWAKETGKSGQTRFTLGRERFLEQAWAWKDYSHGQITSQIRKLGISCDWNNERFTMDPAYVKAVNTAFLKLYEQGMIYRGQRLVNWDPKMQTAVSDLEVMHKEVKGNLWHVRYKFADGGSYNGEDGIEIATTRPETILADGAIAIHPDDSRAQDLVGRMVLVPVVGRSIPIIADTMVDPAFGSGMVKITAAHDFNDFACYQRHSVKHGGTVDIPLINLLNPNGTMNTNCPPAYVGLDRFVARKQIVADLEALGQLIKVEPHTHNVGHAEREEIILEPYLTWQWYVRGAPLAALCLQAIERGEVAFVNERDRKVMRHWLENIEDWCISRQLWWGHRIPAWFKGQEGTLGFEMLIQEASPGAEWRQDEDILDTWFSSALWPFATQGWPAEGGRLATFYPNSAINSGRDILFFWLVRMMMMGLSLIGKVPFKTIYTHGLILDEKGQKMSKSKGNVIDPMVMMERYGTDALRLTMASIASPEDMRFSEQKVEQNRNFCTKLWNAARLLHMNDVSYNAEVALGFDAATLQHPVNQWLVEELKAAFVQLDGHLDAWEFNQAAQVAYHFTWGTFCDWYLELAKPLLQGVPASAGMTAVAEETKACMGWAFTQLLGMLHPFMPFITEELWQRHTAAKDGHFVMLQPWPQVTLWPTFATGHAQTQALVDVLTALRQARMQHKLPPKAKLEVYIRNAKPMVLEVLQNNAAVLHSLGGIETLTPRSHGAEQGEALLQAAGAELILPLQGLVDFAAERQRLEKELGKQQTDLERLMGLLNNPSFVERAPEAEVADKRSRQTELRAAVKGLQALLDGPYRVV